MFFFKLKARFILADVSQVSDAVGKAQNEKYRRVDSELNTRIAFFDLGEGGAANGGALSHRRRGDTAAAAGVPDVRAQFA
jgi:hypothetical protein